MREHIAYKGFKMFHSEGYERANIASRDGSISPYGGFLWFSFEGHSESSEKHTNVGDVVKSPFYIEVGGGSRWAGLQASEAWENGGVLLAYRSGGESLGH